MAQARVESVLLSFEADGLRHYVENFGRRPVNTLGYGHYIHSVCKLRRVTPRPTPMSEAAPTCIRCVLTAPVAHP